MNTTPHGEWADCDIRLTLLGKELRGRVSVPTRAARTADLLPAVYSLADAVVDATTSLLGTEGKAASCRAGCAACCRWPVPVAGSETVHLAQCVDSMPPDRQQIVRRRFDDALARLDRGHVLDKIAERMEAGRPAIGGELAAAYFALNVACPFLEDERCSIYAHRPAVCREHLVTSPPSRCGEAGQETERVLMLARVSPVLFRFQEGAVKETARAVPLVLALARAKSAAEETARRLPGTQLFEAFIREFSATQLGHEVP